MADIGFPKKERCEAVVDVENRMPSMAIKIKCAALTASWKLQRKVCLRQATTAIEIEPQEPQELDVDSL